MIEHLSDGVEALAALARWGTVTEAARRLELGQSAVSKRLQTLEHELGYAVTAPEGRRVVLTAEGQALLDRALPLLQQLRELGSPAAFRAGPLDVVLQDALAATWGPRALRDAAKGLAGVQLSVTVAPAPIAVEHVRSGRHTLALVAGAPADDLVCERIVFEPWVLVHADFARAPAGGPLLAADGAPDALAGRERVPAGGVGSAIRLAGEGFGDALVPLGAALDADLPRRAQEVLDAGREVWLVARRGTGQLPATLALRDGLRERASRRLFGKRR